MPDQHDRIGIIFVHGIGEQRRFEHLDAQIRPLIDAIRRRSDDSKLTVEIVGGGASTLHADQDTWTAQPQAPVRAFVCEDGKLTELCFHEVWWADVNEPYSFKKEWRFWWWGLSIWSLPRKPKSNLPGADNVMTVPVFDRFNIFQRSLARVKLFGASNVFLLGGISVGALVFLARRLLGLSPPNLVRVFVNYVAAVKLYSQRTRVDGGFLDAYQEPPRVSIRRRMIRTIADVADADYTRWYISAHSLGSVVAHNGIMESAHALPNYLDKARWKKLSANAKFGGKMRQGIDLADDVNDMIPARPLWLKKSDVIYREKLFEKFRGLLTYGSPLDKFAAIWPARVSINIKEKAFTKDTHWINVFDPTDPVSGSLDAFDIPQNAKEGSCLKPENYGYAANWVLLLSHLRYFCGIEGRTDHLADRLIDWIFLGGEFSPPHNPLPWLWFGAFSFIGLLRRAVAAATWIVVYCLLAVLGALTIPLWQAVFGELGGQFTRAAGIWSKVPGWPEAFDRFLNSAWDFVGPAWHDVGSPLLAKIHAGIDWLGGYFAVLTGWLTDKFRGTFYMPGFIWDAVRLMGWVALITFLVGIITWLLKFRRDEDDKRKPPDVGAALESAARYAKRQLAKINLPIPAFGGQKRRRGSTAATA